MFVLEIGSGNIKITTDNNNLNRPNNRLKNIILPYNLPLFDLKYPNKILVLKIILLFL